MRREHKLTMKTRTHIYKTGGLPYSVTLPEKADTARLLPSCVPFACEDDGSEPIFRFFASSAAAADMEETLLESGLDDMGFTRLYRTPEGYRFRLSYGYGQAVHTLDTDCSFTCCRAFITPSDRYLPHVLSSFLRIAYSQAVLLHRGVSIHAAAVSTGDGAAIFLGKSGTGKSTHARLWTGTFADCSLINDDNPVLRLEDGRVTVWGTPWSGKTRCWKNVSAPLKGAVRLRQAKANRFNTAKDADALAVLLPGCSVLRHDKTLYASMFDTLSGIIANIRCGYLDCLPDIEAARLCRDNIFGNNTSHNIPYNK